MKMNGAGESTPTSPVGSDAAGTVKMKRKITLMNGTSFAIVTCTSFKRKLKFSQAQQVGFGSFARDLCSEGSLEIPVDKIK